MQIWGKLETLVSEWRADNYSCDYGLISEILLHQKDENGQLSYLREPQFQALETYWYLRLRLGTPTFIDLYKSLCTDKAELARALGLQITGDARFFDIDGYLQAVRDDIQFAAQNNASTLKESLDLDYASYIMALTMGAGKTVLIGTIIATEFAMSMEYSEERFMKNALVFAPGTTIIESLKEISIMPFRRLLPARLAQKFLANVKLVYAKSGDKDLQAQTGSTYNIIVTNTEKIELRKRTIKKGQTTFDYENMLAQDALIANRRLTTIASLPALGIFSDEAHHTYGNKLGENLKRVRETINYLHKEADVVCVVNTTGTPYSGNQTLKDVVFWYSLEQGIKDNVLKSLNRSIITYDFKNTPPDEVFQEVITDFFAKYKDTQLITGQQAKLAFYFKNQTHLDESRPIIERALIGIGESPTLVLMNTQKSSQKEIDEFNRLNDPNASKRVILLVGKGTEGWNCPSLFATALIRELTSSNNFILQASTRCLRQVDGNTQPATIYIESRNQRILNDELQKTFGTSLHELNKTEPKAREVNLVFRKVSYPALKISRTNKRVVRATQLISTDITLTKPKVEQPTTITKEIFTPVSEKSGIILTNTGEEQRFVVKHDTMDIFTAAQLIASNYHIKPSAIYAQLKSLYTDEIPAAHIQELCKQAEAQTSVYEEVEEHVLQDLAIIKFVDENGNETFPKDKDGMYYHTMRVPQSKEKLLTDRAGLKGRNQADLGFHYNPYNFDSEPEQAFLSEMLERLQKKHDEIEDIYFTGGITNPSQTDLHFEYKGEDGRYHQYYPDFVIVKKDGSFVIVEIKALGKESDAEVQAKANALKRLEAIPANRFTYDVLYTDTPIPTSKISAIMEKLV